MDQNDTADSDEDESIKIDGLNEKIGNLKRKSNDMSKFRTK